MSRTQKSRTTSIALLLSLGAAALAGCGEQTALPGHFQPEADLPDVVAPSAGEATPEEVATAATSAPASAASQGTIAPVLPWRAPLPRLIGNALTVSGPTDATAFDPSASPTPATTPSGVAATHLSPGDVCTYPAEAWAVPCHGNPTEIACALEGEFARIFGDEGIVLGGEHTFQLTRPEALERALPGGAPAAILTEDVIDPSRTQTNALAAEVVALWLNLVLSENGDAGRLYLGDLKVATGDFRGATVEEVFQFAEAYLGGEDGTTQAFALPPARVAARLHEINAAGRGCAATGFLQP